jgi:hypothetical protein
MLSGINRWLERSLSQCVVVPLAVAVVAGLVIALILQ